MNFNVKYVMYKLSIQILFLYVILLLIIIVLLLYYCYFNLGYDVFVVCSLGYWMLICLLLFYVLATSKVISGWVLICDSAHSW